MSFGRPFGSSAEEKIYNCRGEEICNPKILIVGCGGAGCNTVTRLANLGIGSAETIALDSDAHHLAMALADRKILLGPGVAKGLGTSGDLNLGRDAAEGSRRSLARALDGADLVFILAGIGGGAGTGAAPIVAEEARNKGSTTICAATLPLLAERAKTTIVERGLEEMGNAANTLIVFDSNKVLNFTRHLSAGQIFSVMDQIIAEITKGIIETMTQPSIINLDYADVKTIMGCGGISLVLVGEGDLKDDPEELIKSALITPMIEADYSGASGCLLHITGGHDLTLRYAANLSSLLTKRLNPKANVIWGARLKREMKGRVGVLAVMTGIEASSLVYPAEPRNWPDLSLWIDTQ